MGGIIHSLARQTKLHPLNIEATVRHKSFSLLLAASLCCSLSAGPATQSSVAVYLPLVTRSYPLPALIPKASFPTVSMTEGWGHPPDPGLAVGPSAIFVTTNQFVELYDKAGRRFAQSHIWDFFGPVKPVPDEFAVDPRVVFDPGSGRFFLVAKGGKFNDACVPGACIFHFLFAVSKSSTPQSLSQNDWHLYALDSTLNITPDGTTQTTFAPDFTSMAVNQEVVVMTAHMTQGSQEIYQYEKVRVLDKSRVIQGQSAVWTDFVDPRVGGTKIYGLQPAIHPDGSPGAFYLFTPFGGAPCTVVVWRITQPLTATTLSYQQVADPDPCEGPPPGGAPQPGGPNLDVDQFAIRERPVYRNGSLWVPLQISRNFGNGPVSAIRLLQIDVSNWPALSIVQDATLGQDGAWYFFPALTVSQNNDVALVFACSGAGLYPSICYSGRLSSDPPDTLRPVKTLGAGTVSQAWVNGAGRARYGDYFGAALDPGDGSAWIVGEYPLTPQLWGTWAANLAWIGEP